MSAPLEDFFAQFANLSFEYRGNATAHSNLERLRQVSRWDEDSTEWRETVEDFNNALTRQFNVTIGTQTDLSSWQDMCRRIAITPIPDTIQECRRRVRDSHINIVDLLESERIGGPIRKFRTVEELSVYTISTGRIFPKGSAYAGGLLKELLREIFKHGNRRSGAGQSGAARRRRRRARRRAAAAAAATQTSAS